jgi:hypothetical protein
VWRKVPHLWRHGENKIPGRKRKERPSSENVLTIQTMICGRDNQSVRSTKRKTAKKKYANMEV